MKIILTAVNAKYIHSNLAVYTLQASAEKAGVFPEIREFTINQSKDSMLRSLFLARADVCLRFLLHLEYINRRGSDYRIS